MIRILIICLGIFLFSVAGVFIITLPKEIRSLSSPNNEYTVQITERRAFPFIDSESLYLNASRGDNLILKEKILYTGDFMDDDFIDRYPYYLWLSESVLKIGQFRESPPDELLISNETPLELKYLLIETYEDKFIVFDIKPGQKIDLSFLYFGQLSVQGEFITGEHFGDAVELRSETASNTKRRFLVRVKDEKATIETPGEAAKRVTCCAVDRPSFE